MYTVGIHEAKTHLSKLIERVLEGQEVIISRSGEPVAKLLPIDKKPLKKRVPGMDKGKVWIADDFDEIPEGFED